MPELKCQECDEIIGHQWGGLCSKDWKCSMC